MTLLARFALLCMLAMAASRAFAAPPLSDDKRQALAQFIVAYRLADAWPQMAPKIARDSLPRLENATHADLDADAFADRAQSDAAHARVPALLDQGRRELEAALQRFDADELAAYTAYEIYAKYFETAEIRELTAFWNSPTGLKMSATAEQIREDMHAHFIERSEPALQGVARHVATEAETSSK